MGQCYAFHLSRILTSVDTFFFNTFLLLYVHFSFDAAFVELHLLDKLTKTLRFISSVFYAIIVKITSCLSSIFFFRNLTGKVTALFKYEDKSDINNCSPIKVLPKFNKILERVLHQQLYGYMTEPNLLTAKQFVSFYGQSSKET